MPSLISTIPSTFDLWFTLAIILGVLFLLAVDKGPPHFVMLGAVVILWNANVITVTDALAGFSNTSMITVGGLFITVGALDKSRIINWLANRVMGRHSSQLWASAKLQVLAFFLSAVTNNIPMQALLLPIVCDWCRSRQYPSSKFLLPLNYANIGGGLLATIGTSTNLVVNGLLETQKPPQKPFAFFEPGYVGLPIGIIAMLFMLAVHRWLPDNSEVFLKSVRDRSEDLTTAFELSPHSSFVGKTVAETLSLCGMSVQDCVKIWRPPPGKQLVEKEPEGPAKVSLKDAVRAFFTGREVTGWNKLVSCSAVELGFDAGDTLVLKVRKPVLLDVLSFYKRDLLVASEPAVSRLCSPGEFLEVVLGLDSPLVGQPVRFASKLVDKYYGAGLVGLRLSEDAQEASDVADVVSDEVSANAVVPLDTAVINLDDVTAVAAVTERPATETVLGSGDRLVLLAPPGTQLPRNDVILQTTLGPLKPPVWLYHIIPVLLFVAGVTWASFDETAMVRVSVGLFTLFVLGGWIAVEDVRYVMEWDILILIATSLALGTALSKSGLANALGILVRAANLGPQGSLFLLTAAVIVLNEIVTNNAAATLGIPVAVAMAKELKLTSVRPFAMAVLLGGSAAYACPIGYATHMMVMGPGNYTLKHFLIFGIPLDIIYIAGITVILPWMFPLQ